MMAVQANLDSDNVFQFSWNGNKNIKIKFIFTKLYQNLGKTCSFALYLEQNA